MHINRNHHHPRQFSVSEIILMVGSHSSLTPDIAYLQQTNNRFSLPRLFLFILLLIALLTVNDVSKFLSDQSYRFFFFRSSPLLLSLCSVSLKLLDRVHHLPQPFLKMIITRDYFGRVFSSPLVLFDPNSHILHNVQAYITMEGVGWVHLAVTQPVYRLTPG